MKSVRRFTIVCAVIMLVAGCATVPMATSDLDVQGKGFGPTPGKANLYIARRPGYVGSAILFHLSVDGNPVGSIGPGVYHLVAVDPGTHTIMVWSNENNRDVTFEAGADTNYYFKVETLPGLLTARTGIQWLDEINGRALVLKCRRAVSMWNQ